jgi:ribose 1,5-bisphosphokinase PhnN
MFTRAAHPPCAAEDATGRGPANSARANATCLLHNGMTREKDWSGEVHWLTLLRVSQFTVKSDVRDFELHWKRHGRYDTLIVEIFCYTQASKKYGIPQTK